MATAAALTIEPVTTRICAVVEGVDLTRPLDGRSVETIRQTVLDHGVAFLRVEDAPAPDFVTGGGGHPGIVLPS